MSKLIIGIDPGAAGGLATLTDGGPVFTAKLDKFTPAVLLHEFKRFADYPMKMAAGNALLGDDGMQTEADGPKHGVTFSPPGPRSVVAYLEDVGHGMPGQSSSATAKFARHCGHIEMALLAAGIPCVKVSPQKWMRALGLGSSKTYPTKVAWKNHLKAKAEELFPTVKFTLATCDAALIAWYGLQQERGNNAQKAQQ